METIGYVLGDIVELHTTATRKKKSVLQKIVFAGVALLLLVFIAYELFLLVESYKHPTWIPNVKHMENIQYPEIILFVTIFTHHSFFSFLLLFSKKKKKKKKLST